jgi:hypothetical protein
MARRCPFLEIGGCIEVGELTLLTPGDVATTVEDRARAIKVANDATLGKTTAR